MEFAKSYESQKITLFYLHQQVLAISRTLLELLLIKCYLIQDSRSKKKV